MTYAKIKPKYAYFVYIVLSYQFILHYFSSVIIMIDRLFTVMKRLFTDYLPI